jgi:CRISPR-associated exonuclease Cas4
LAGALSERTRNPRERLNLRAILMARSPDQASRALANVDALVERARAYGVRGFRQFALDLDAEWTRRASRSEGVMDDEGDAVQLVTIHSSKGLEWPVVIPINTASGPRPPEKLVYRRSDETLHWRLGDIVPPSLAEAMQTEAQEEAQQRLRLLYVACTRAMDLLVLTEFSWTNDAAWARAVDFKLNDVPLLDLANLPKQAFAGPSEPPNAQTGELFADEQARLAESFQPIRWIRPSEAEEDLVQFEMGGTIGHELPIDAVAVTAGGSRRGIILHKLMEELLTGEVDETMEGVQQRAAILIGQVVPADWPSPALDAQEIAGTALRTLCLPALANREEIVPEVPVYGIMGGDLLRLVSGRADAVRYRDGRANIVFDWKSDPDAQPAVRLAYAQQLATYIEVLGAERGAVVYMTTGEIEWITPNTATTTTNTINTILWN